MSKIMPTSRRIKIEEDNITRKKKKNWNKLSHFNKMQHLEK